MYGFCLCPSLSQTRVWPASRLTINEHGHTPSPFHPSLAQLLFLFFSHHCLPSPEGLHVRPSRALVFAQLTRLIPLRGGGGRCGERARGMPTNMEAWC